MSSDGWANVGNVRIHEFISAGAAANACCRQSGSFAAYWADRDEGNVMSNDTDNAPAGTGQPPVTDWTTDYDIFDAEYITDPYPIWADLRNACPVAHTERWGGSWLPTKYEDVVAMARMVPELSSADPIVVRPPEADQVIEPGGSYHTINAPPISADPPIHTW